MRLTLFSVVGHWSLDSGVLSSFKQPQMAELGLGATCDHLLAIWHELGRVLTHGELKTPLSRDLAKAWCASLVSASVIKTMPKSNSGRGGQGFLGFNPQVTVTEGRETGAEAETIKGWVLCLPGLLSLLSSPSQAHLPLGSPTPGIILENALHASLKAI